MKNVTWSLALPIIATLAGCSAKQLVVKSEPADANVYIKGFDQKYFPGEKVKIGSTPYKGESYTFVDAHGKKKSVNFDDIADKEFYVIVEKPEFETKAVEATNLYQDIRLLAMPARSEAVRAPVLEVEKQGAVRITSNPPGAKIYLDNDLIGNTPLDVVRPVGRHQLQVSLTKHQDVNESLVFAATGVKVVNFDLIVNESKAPVAIEKIPTGIKVSSSPAGSEVFINGELVGNTPFDFSRAPASYKLRIQHADYLPKEETVTVINGEMKSLHIELEKVAPPSAIPAQASQ